MGGGGWVGSRAEGAGGEGQPVPFPSRFGGHMANLREIIEKDLEVSLEGDYALPVVLIGPDGTVYTEKVNGDDLVGQVLYSSLKFDPDTGAQVVVPQPVVTLRVSSLQRVPADGEAWGVKIPITPSTTAPLKEFSMERPVEANTIGFIRLYLVEVDAA